MKQSFFRNTSARFGIFVSIILFFILIANYIYKILPNKWYVLYKIDPNIEISVSSGIINGIFKEIEFVDSNEFTVIEFIKKEIATTETMLIEEKFPNIEKPSFTGTSVGLYTSNLSKIDQELDIIINEIEKDIKVKLLNTLNTYKELAKIVMDIKHTDEINKKKNEIAYYNSAEYVNEAGTLIISKSIDDNDNTQSPFTYKTYDPMSQAKFELEMIIKNGGKNYQLLNILENIEKQIENTKLFKIGKKVDQFDKNPSRFFLIATFLIIGLFFGFIFVLLTSKISKKLMIKMSSLLLNLK